MGESASHAARASERIRRWWGERLTKQPQSVVPSGTWHYMREADGQQTRFHLRVDSDGSGVLLANATRAAQLTATGTFIARKLLAGDDPRSIEYDVLRSFRGAGDDAIRRDVEQVRQLIEALAAPGDNYPILNLTERDFASAAGREIPFSADLPLAPPGQVVPLLDRLWESGIPHVTFHVFEAPNADALVRAVERAEDLGMIAGVRGAAAHFDEPELLRRLALAGIDHVNLYCLSAGGALHDEFFGEGDHASVRRLIEALLALEVCPVAEVPLIEATAFAVDKTVAELLPLGVSNFAFFAIAAPDELSSDERQGVLSAAAVAQSAALIEEASADWNARSLWYPPVRRDPRLSLADQLRRGPGSSGDHSIRVSPAGSVYPPRGPLESAGNLLDADWPALRSHAVFARYLQELARPTVCDTCPGLSLCAAACPRSPAGWVDSWPSDVSSRKEA